MTFDEMCKQRDPLYQATEPHGEWRFVFMLDAEAQRKDRDGGWKSFQLFLRDYYLLKLAIRALRNQGEPYYPRR